MVGSPQAYPGQWIEEAGYFWFFNPANVEMIVKVLDDWGLGIDSGCSRRV